MELSKQRAATDSASFKKQQKRNIEPSVVTNYTRPDDLTNAESRGDCFANSAHEHILDKHHGFGKVKPTEEIHQLDKGLKTLSSDSRKGHAPLPEDGVKLDIHGRRRDAHVIGRSINDVNDDCTVYGEDRFEHGEKRDAVKYRGKNKPV